MNSKPFSYISLGRKLTKAELARAIRQDIIAENDTIALYEAHCQSTADPSVIAVLDYVIADEKEHSAMLQALLERLDNDQALLTVKGRNHADELFTNKLMDEAIEVAPDAMIAPSEPFATEGDAEFPGGSFIAAEPANADDEGFSEDMIHGVIGDKAKEDFIDDAGSLGGLKGKGMI
jgi:rubrerythrin